MCCEKSEIKKRKQGQHKEQTPSKRHKQQTLKDNKRGRTIPSSFLLLTLYDVFLTNFYAKSTMCVLSFAWNVRKIEAPQDVFVPLLGFREIKEERVCEFKSYKRKRETRVGNFFPPSRAFFSEFFLDTTHFSFHVSFLNHHIPPKKKNKKKK